eukprot:g2343.t1
MLYLCTVILLWQIAFGADIPNLIVDTDLGFDVDDVAAVCLANELHLQSRVNLKGVLHNTGCHLGIGGVSSINHFYGNDNVSLGAYQGNFGSDCYTHFNGAFGQNQYLSKLIADVPGPITDASQVPSPVTVYREILSQANNNSITIASIGFPVNILDALRSKSDKVSSLTGYELFESKVSKIVFMDGSYNFGCSQGLIGSAQECQGSAKAMLEEMPSSVKLVISNKGSGPDIYSGQGLMTSHPTNSPCRIAFENWCCNPNGQGGRQAGRLSWDPIATMIAALGVESVQEKEVNCGVKITANDDGTREYFTPSNTKNCQTDFVDGNKSPSAIPGIINAILDQVPSH